MSSSASLLEQHELKLWDKFKDLEYPDVFSFLKLAEDGGFSEVKDMYSPARWVSVVSLFVFVIYNVEAVTLMDFNFIRDPEAALTSLGATDLSVANDFYFSAPISNFILSKITGDEKASVSPVQVVGILELIGLSYYLLSIVVCLYHIKMDKNEGFKKWYYIQSVSWDILPALSSYSAMKLLNHVVPAVAATRMIELIESVAESKRDKKSTIPHYFAILVWICTMVFGFVVGFDTFLMKLRVVSLKANTQEMSFGIVLPVVQFLVQVLGVVQLGPFVRKRLFVFIFGGEDGIMQDEETELMETWNALLARRMYTDLPYSHFIAVLFSFSDEDFQGLVLNEDKVEKDKMNMATQEGDALSQPFLTA